MPEVPLKIKVIDNAVSMTREEIRTKLIQSVMNTAKIEKQTPEQVIAKAQKLYDWVVASDSK